MSQKDYMPHNWMRHRSPRKPLIDDTAALRAEFRAYWSDVDAALAALGHPGSALGPAHRCWARNISPAEAASYLIQTGTVPARED